MTTWRPITLSEVKQALDDALSNLHPVHRAKFEAIRISPTQIPVKSSPGEFVFAVAKHQGNFLYYSDIEDGWELETSNSNGGIDTRGCNQYELTHIMHQTFGDPDA